MKPALRWIPTEVWMDIFRYPWITRKELGEIVDQFGNRKFAEFLQFYLHDWGKRTLKRLWICQDGLHKSVNHPPYLSYIAYPMAPMPGNIKFFKRITIGRFDSEALAFLRQINPLFISNDVNLCFDGNYFDFWPRLTNSRTVLDHVAPLLNGIHSISVRPSAIPLVKQYFTAKLPQIKMLGIYFGYDLLTDQRVTDQAEIETGINFCMNWLISGQREFTMLKVFSYEGYQIDRQFSKAVQQQFLTAKSACTFAIRFESSVGYCIDAFHLENNLGEQLHGQFDKAGKFQIIRHPPNGDKALQEWVETVEKCDNTNVIKFLDRLTIGPIATDSSGVNNAGEEQEGPSTSKKPKLTQ